MAQHQQQHQQPPPLPHGSPKWNHVSCESDIFENYDEFGDSLLNGSATGGVDSGTGRLGGGAGGAADFDAYVPSTPTLPSSSPAAPPHAHGSGGGSGGSSRFSRGDTPQSPQQHSPPMNNRQQQQHQEHNNPSPHLLSPDSLSGASGSVGPSPLLAAPKDTHHHQHRPEPTRNILNAKLRKGKHLGSGSFGTVFQAMDVETGALVAVKQIKITPGNSQSQGIIKSVQREIEVMSSLPPHPNCVQYLGSKQSDRHVSIFMEYVSGGTVDHLLKEYGCFSEGTMRRYAQMVLEGLNHLHSHGIIHQDIKGGNVLVDEQGRVAKIADFGCSKDLAKMTASMRTTGTPLWMAPEVCSQGKADYRSDVWSFGCLLLEMVKEDHLPWSNFASDSSIFAVMYAIAGAKEGPEIPSKLSPVARDFISRCFVIDPAKRPSVQELLQHPFLVAPVQQNPLAPRTPRHEAGTSFVDADGNDIDNDSFSSHNSTFVTEALSATPKQKNLLVSDDSISPVLAMGNPNQNQPQQNGQPQRLPTQQQGASPQHASPSGAHHGSTFDALSTPKPDEKKIVFQGKGKGSVRDNNLVIAEPMTPAHSSPVSGGRKPLGKRDEGVLDKFLGLFQ